VSAVSTRPPCGPRSSRRHRPAGAVTSRTGARAALTTAVALLTRMTLAEEVPRDQVLGGEDPAAVLAVMEVVAATVLRDAWPEDGGAEVLGRIGLAVADFGGDPR
jgi:hypothetical protein